MVKFENIRIIYPDYLGVGQFNKYKRNLFNFVTVPEEVPMLEQSGIKVKWTKPSQRFPEPEPYVEVSMGYTFPNATTGLMEPADNPPEIILNNTATGQPLVITYETLDVLAAARLSNINIELFQSKPKLVPVPGGAGTVLRSTFYLRRMTADMIPFYSQS